MVSPWSPQAERVIGELEKIADIIEQLKQKILDEGNVPDRTIPVLLILREHLHEIVKEIRQEKG